MNSQTFIRTVSAAVAALIFASVGYFFKVPGIVGLISVVTLIGCFELGRLLFSQSAKSNFQPLGLLLIYCTYMVNSFFPYFGNLPMAVSGLFFLGYVLFHAHRFSDLSQLYDLAGRFLLGLIYLGLLPAYGVRLLMLNNGLKWFFCLLAVVFAGDILAYFVGRAVGKTKLMPLISPKKTVEGAIGGLVGSIVCAGLTATLFENSDPITFGIMGAAVGGAAQVGDLFESSLKRIANMKDSGTIMPGHGGVLDRVDGVLFAAPLVYAFANFMAF